MVKNHLSLAIVLGLGITSASAGELTFSPTVESRLSAFSTNAGDSEQSPTVNDTLILNELDVDVDYASNIFTSKINVNIFNKRYGKEESSNDDFLSYSWNNTLSVLNDNWVSDAYYEFDYQILDDAKSTFNDLMYQTGNISDVERYGVSTSYSIPKLPRRIQGSIYASLKGDTAESDVAIEKSKQTQKEVNFNLNQGESSHTLQWQISGYLSEKESELGVDDSNRTGDALLRLPFLPSFMAVGTASYIYQQSQDSSLSDEDELEEPIEYSSYGGGFAYYDSKKGNLFQVTASLDSRNDDYFFGTELRWIFDDEHYVNGKVSRKFYGDSGEFKYFYSSDRNSFEIYYDEDIELRYMLEQEVINEGIYVCVDGVDFFEESFCRQPEQLNYELKPGETIVPKIDISYPLVDRLVLNKNLGFNWSYKTDFFNSKFQAYKNTMEEIDKNYEQESDNISLLFSHRLNSLSSIDYEFKYRKMTFLPDGNRTYDVLYKANYSHELNTRAKWSVGLQYVGKNSDYKIDNFNEVRLTLSYEHHFGQKNTKIRSMF